MSAAGSWPDDDSAHDADEGVPHLPAEWAGIVIPDDARELAGEAAALRRELRRRHRADRLAGLLRTRRFERFGISGPLVVICVVLTAFFASLLFLLPTGQQAPITARLAQTSLPDGSQGGLLPAMTLSTSLGATVQTRSLRPAVVLLTSDGCSTCAQMVGEVVSATSTSRVDVLVVAEASQSAAPLPANAPRERVVSASDPGHVLGDAVRAQSVAVTRGSTHAAPIGIFIRADGRIVSVLPTVTAQSNLSAEIADITS